MTADLAQLGQALDRERRDGCRDEAVQGGLDELLRRQARDEPARSPLMRMVMALPDAGYRSLGAEERERWLRRAQATIAEARAGARPAPRRTAAPKGAVPRVTAPAARHPHAPGARAQATTPRAPTGAAALELPIEQAGTRLGKANLGRLRRIGIETAGDALRHWPRRHKDFTRTVPIAGLRIGEEQTLRGVVEDAREARWGRKGTEATIGDGTGARLRVFWSNQPWVAKELRPGMEIALSGKVTAYRGRPTLANPDYERLDGEQRHTCRLVPIYRSTAGLPQKTLRTAIARVLDRFGDRLPETLPEDRRASRGLPGVAEAVRQMHYPDDEERLALAMQRLAFDERLAVQLGAEERERWLRRAQATIAQARAGADRAPRRTAADGGTVPRAPAPTARRERVQAAPPRTPAGAAALELPIEQAGTRLGKENLSRLRRIGIETAGDALRHWPHRHKDFTRTVPIAGLRIGEEQTLRGVVEIAREARWGRKGTEATIGDGTGARLRVFWFNQPWIARDLPSGMEIALSGKVTAYRGRPTLANPDYERLDREQRHTGRLVPIYPSTAGLAQKTLRDAIWRVLDRFADRLPETLPEDLRARRGLPGAVEAARQMHYPDDEERLALAKRRLAFDELLAVQLGAVRRKRERQSRGAPPCEDRTVAKAFLDALHFALTGAQRRALGEVLADLGQPRPMARLLQGDVGSGKTVVALAAMLAAVAGGCQAALMAPTEVLAEQHYRTLCALLSGEPEPPLRGMVRLPCLPQPLRVVLLTGSVRAKERRDALDAIRHGGAQIAVGTHALIQRDVGFRRLGLAVVDEQHRFGVDQREAIRGAPGQRYGDSGGEVGPHLLVMTATPIPRSLALTIYGDLDLTTIGELPPGRAPTETVAIPQPPWDDAGAMREYAERRAEAFARVRAEVAAGRQAFVICPLVEGSASVAARAATEEYERLCREEFPELAGRIELLHGRMSGRVKDAAMRRFAAGETAILVSTAVVEVGIDVPNATAMVIEGANRFGLAQLHQFRGRIGRGRHASICFLLGDDPRPPEPPAWEESDEQRQVREQREQQREQRREAAAERLSLVERNRDGFDLAQADLDLRDAGDLFGTRQAGESSLRVASLRDVRLIETSRREAEALLDADPALAAPQHAALRAIAAAAEAAAEAH